jgi:hypothetical protein
MEPVLEERVVPRLLTGRKRQACALRDACMMLVARYGLATEQNGTHLTEVVLEPFRIWLTPSGTRRAVDVWYAGADDAKVLTLGWSGDEVTVVSFRRGSWEQELLALGRRDASSP